MAQGLRSEQEAGGAAQPTPLPAGALRAPQGAAAAALESPSPRQQRLDVPFSVFRWPPNLRALAAVEFQLASTHPGVEQGARCRGPSALVLGHGAVTLARAGCCAPVCSRLGSPNVCSPPGQSEPLRKRRIGLESLTRIGASAPELVGLLG